MKILVTGGTSGIGRSIVKLMSLQGHDVVFVGRDADRGLDVEQMSGATFIRADLSIPDQCEKAITEYFSIYETCDILINNAGLWTEGKLEDTNIDEIQDVITINTLSPIIFTNIFVKRIQENRRNSLQDSARIIFINSIAGLNAKAERTVYNASKWAITGFARSLTLELAKDNIAVTNLSPGYVQTELFDHAGYTRDIQGAMQPDNVAQAIEYICNLPKDITINELAIKPTTYS